MSRFLAKFLIFAKANLIYVLFGSVVSTTPSNLSLGFIVMNCSNVPDKAVVAFNLSSETFAIGVGTSSS